MRMKDSLSILINPHKTNLTFFCDTSFASLRENYFYSYFRTIATKGE